MVKKFLTCQKAATAVEYALIATLICVVVLAGVRGFSEATNVRYTEVKDAVR